MLRVASAALIGSMQKLFYLVQIGAFLDGNELVLGRHDVPHRSIHAAFETDITAGLIWAWR